MKKIFAVLILIGTITACASPREAARIYNVQPQQTVVFCNEVDFETVLKALKGGIILNVPISVFADMEKKQDTRATADISPTVEITP